LPVGQFPDDITFSRADVQASRWDAVFDGDFNRQRMPPGLSWSRFGRCRSGIADAVI
jgi:hypothetical protein